jgi:hypothetical protein
VGDHDGGELWQFHAGGRGEILHIKNNPSMSNGLLPHATLPFLGERFSLVYYCLRSWRESPRPEDAEFLKDLGFWAMDQLPPYKPEDYAPRHDLIPLAAVQLQSILTHYVVAIPSYKRPGVIVKKTSKTLKEGGVPSSVIYIFVADEDEAKIYENTVPKELYNQIVVGVKGIAAQRNFIVKYFPEGQYVVSFDDDVEQVDRRNGSTELVKEEDLDKLFKDAYNDLWKAGIYIWGVYPVHNPFFMSDTVSTGGLKFIIGVMRGFINRHSEDLEPSPLAEGKEDYEQSILYYRKDGGVLRYNTRQR